MAINVTYVIRFGKNWPISLKKLSRHKSVANFAGLRDTSEAGEKNSSEANGRHGIINFHQTMKSIL